jgi:nucleoside-diphosphate-sugar epimerase
VGPATRRKIHVLGATGLIGSALVHELAERGHEVSGSGRSGSRPRNLVGIDFTYLPGNQDDDGQLDAWLSGKDIVIDAAAPYPLHLLTASTDDEKLPLAYAERRSEAVIDALRKTSARYFCISTALLEPREQPVSLADLQSKLVRRLYPYFAVKRTIEERMLSAARTGNPTVIVRPTACIGPWDIKPRELCWIPKLLCGEVPAVLRHRINVLDTRDLAAAVAVAIEEDVNTGTLVVAGHNTTTNELLEILCRSAGVPAPRVDIPAAMSILPLLWAEMAWATIGSPSPLPSLVPALLCEQRWIEPGCHENLMQINPRPLADTAHDTVAWYRSLGYC